jgi:hypothetical protein
MQVELGLRSWLNAEAGAFTCELNLEDSPRLGKWLLNQSVECPFHDEFTNHRISAVSNATAADLLREAGSGFALLLDWAVCIESQCLDCSHRWRPFMRLSRFRKSGRCPVCRSSRLAARQTLRSIDSDSEWASIPLTALGVPEDHMLTILPVSNSLKS